VLDRLCLFEGRTMDSMGASFECENKSPLGPFGWCMRVNVNCGRGRLSGPLQSRRVMFRKGLNCALTVCEYILVICNPYVLFMCENAWSETMH
jgi:hypothetical protein